MRNPASHQCPWGRRGLDDRTPRGPSPHVVAPIRLPGVQPAAEARGSRPSGPQALVVLDQIRRAGSGRALAQGAQVRRRPSPGDAVGGHAGRPGGCRRPPVRSRRGPRGPRPPGPGHEPRVVRHPAEGRGVLAGEEVPGAPARTSAVLIAQGLAAAGGDARASSAANSVRRFASGSRVLGAADSAAASNEPPASGSAQSRSSSPSSAERLAQWDA